jgi:hypothetical protein
MSFRILFASCVAVLLCSTELLAQRIPIGALPTRYNGGFAGETGTLRVASFSFIEYGPIPYPPPSGSNRISRGTFISADHFLKKLRSGIAFTVGHVSGQQGYLSDYRYTSMSLAISPKFSFKGKYTFAPFADFSFGNSMYRWDPSFYHNEVDDVNDFNIKTGFLVNSKKAYMGISADVLQYSDYYNKLQFFSDMRYSLQAGYSFQRTPESEFSFTPQLLVSYQRWYINNIFTNQPERLNLIILLDLNLVFRYKKFISGINNTGVMFGYQNNRFKLQVSNFYSPGFSTNIRSQLSDHTHFLANLFTIGPDTYSGNISLRYIFSKKPSVKMPGF